MIKINNILKILIVGVCMAFYGIPSAFSDDVTTDWRSGDEGGTQKGYATPSVSSGDSGTPSGGSSGAASSDPGETIEEPVDHDTYSNIYPDSEEGVAILPQAMVEYCKFNAAAAVKDLNIITECIKKYANAMHNSNVASKAEALHDYDTMRAQALIRTLIEATAIVSNVPNYDKVQDKYKEAGHGGKTEFDAIQANTSSHAMSTKMINDVWKLYSEYLQYLAIDGIANIDPTALASDEKAEENKSTVKGKSEMKTKAGTTRAETVIEGPISGSSTGSGGGSGDGGDGSQSGNGTGDGNGGDGNDSNTSRGSDNSTGDNTASGDYSSVSTEDLERQHNEARSDRDEYNEYKAAVKDGNEWEVDAETMARWKAADDAYIQTLLELQRRKNGE